MSTGGFDRVLGVDDAAGAVAVVYFLAAVTGLATFTVLAFDAVKRGIVVLVRTVDLDVALREVVALRTEDVLRQSVEVLIVDESRW